jgi:hypothetical protein
LHPFSSFVASERADPAKVVPALRVQFAALLIGYKRFQFFHAPAYVVEHIVDDVLRRL